MAIESNVVTVYVPRDEADHLAVGTILHNAGIEYYSKNAHVQNLFGAGQIGGSNLITGGIEIQVAAGEAGKAKEVIDEFVGSGIDDSEMDDMGEAEDDSSPGAQEIVTRMINKCIVFSIFWFGGIGSILAIFFGLKALMRIKNENEVELKGRGKVIVGIIVGLLGVFLSFHLWFGELVS